MKVVTKRLGVAILILFISFCINVSGIAQTPADDPGIGGPGVGAAPAGDGSSIVPFDGGMSLMLAASGIGYVIKNHRSNHLFER